MNTQTVVLILGTVCIVSSLMVGPVYLLVAQARKIEAQAVELRKLIGDGLLAKSELATLIKTISECQHNDGSCPAKGNRTYCAGNLKESKLSQ